VSIRLFLPFTVTRAQSTEPDLFIEAYVSLPEPYAGQQIEFLVRFFDAVGANNPLYEAPSFEGFWRVEPDRISRTVEVRGTRQYNVTDIRTTLYPNVPGDVIIDPARVTVPETVFAPEQVFETLPLLVRARPLPEGAPEGFSGAVGQLALEAGLTSQQVQVGEPITLRLLLIGDANVLVLPPPDITALQGWRAYVQSRTATFETASPGLIGQQEILIVLFPSQAGSFTLPALAFPYFNPATNAYSAVSTGEIPLEVLPAPDAPPPAVPVSLAPALRPVDLNRVAGGSSGLKQGVWWLIGPLALLAALLWRWRSTIQERWFGGEPHPRTPLQQARRSVRVALRASNPAAALHAALYDFLKTKSAQAEATSLLELADQLRQSRLNGPLGTRLTDLMDDLNAAQYAPSELAPRKDIRQQAQQLDSLLVELDAAFP
jgi:hypothetical protein